MLPEAIRVIANSIWSDILGLIAAGGLGYIVRKLKISKPIQNLWKIQNYSNVTLCIAESKRDPKDIGGISKILKYTGLGQVKALGLVVESLSKAYPLTMDNIVFSTDKLDQRTESDLILFGGPLSNKITKRFLNVIKSLDIVESTEHAFIWKRGHVRKYEASSDHSSDFDIDYGLIVRMPNPFDTNRRSTLCLFAGCHSNGTIAAAKYFTEDYIKKYSFWNRLKGYNPKTTFIIVKCKVNNDETYPYNFELQELYEE